MLRMFKFVACLEAVALMALMICSGLLVSHILILGSVAFMLCSVLFLWIGICWSIGKLNWLMPPLGSVIMNVGFCVFTIPLGWFSGLEQSLLPLFSSVVVLFVLDLYAIMLSHKLGYEDPVPVRSKSCLWLTFAEMFLAFILCIVFGLQIWQENKMLGVLAGVAALGIIVYLVISNRSRLERSKPISDILFDLVISTLAFVSAFETSTYRVPICLVGVIALVDLLRGVLMRKPEK